MIREPVRAELADDHVTVLLLDRTGAVLRTLAVEEAASLHTDLGSALKRHREANPPRLPSEVGGFPINGRRCMIDERSRRE